VKRIQEQTLYEILEVALAASAVEIEAAYARAKALYGPGSLATYTLMSPEEAQLLAGRIEEAGRVLLDAQARRRYDATLVAEPATPATPATPEPALPSAAADVNGEVSRVVPVIIPALSLARAVFADDGAGRDDEDVEADGAETFEDEREPVRAGEESEPPLGLAVPVEEAPVRPSPPPTTLAPPPIALAVAVPEPVPLPPVIPALAELPSPTALSVETIAPAAQLLAAAAAAGGPADAVAPPIRAPIPLRNEVAVTPPPAEPMRLSEPAGPPEPVRPSEPVREASVVVPEGTSWTGDVLRQIREARGLSLKTLAERTRVTRHHIENIEGDRFKLLPAPVYLRGILMTLARELRLDGQKVAKSYLERASRPG
jgi:hypothetical protein